MATHAVEKNKTRREDRQCWGWDERLRKRVEDASFVKVWVQAGRGAGAKTIPPWEKAWLFREQQASGDCRTS